MPIAAKPPITPPTMAPTFDDFFVELFPPWLVGFPVVDGGEAWVDDCERGVDNEPELVEVPDSGTVEGVGAKDSGKPPAALAATGSNTPSMV